jgi:hypothetical protein
MEKIPEPQFLPEGYFYHNEGYLWHILPIEAFSDLPEKVEVRGEEFQRKQEFHVTVANVRAVAQEIAQKNEDVESIEVSIQKLLTEYIQSNTIHFEGFEEDLRLAITEERKSVAARCRMSGIEGYLDLIKEKYGKEFTLQPAHVSIYTVNGMAVGINSDEQIESYSKIELPEVQKVLNSVEI